MNGEEIVKEIDTRLVKLETRFEERWTNHDKQADDRQKATCIKLDDIKESIDKLNAEFVSLDKTTILMVNTVNERITKLPCDRQAGLFSGITTQVKFIWGVLILMVGAIITDWVKKR